jgi:hypothetical protein
MWTFTIPRSVPSANAHIVNGNHHATASKYRSFRNVWARDLATLKMVHRIPPATGKRLVTIERLWGAGQRAYDYDNLVTGCKALVDAMKPPKKYHARVVPGASLIVDDSPAHVTVTYLQQRAEDGIPSTRITISEDVTP